MLRKKLKLSGFKKKLQDKIPQQVSELFQDFLLFASLYLLVIIFRYFFETGCPIRFITGIPCLGCGMTRALTAILRFDFYQAFQYHPLIFLMPIFIFRYAYLKLKCKSINRLIYIMSALFIITYIVRVATKNPVVDISFKDSLIYKLYELF